MTQRRVVNCAFACEVCGAHVETYARPGRAMPRACGSSHAAILRNRDRAAVAVVKPAKARSGARKPPTSGEVPASTAFVVLDVRGMELESCAEPMTALRHSRTVYRDAVAVLGAPRGVLVAAVARGDGRTAALKAERAAARWRQAHVPAPVPSARDAKVAELHAKGLSSREIGAVVGIGASTAARIVRALQQTSAPLVGGLLDADAASTGAGRPVGHAHRASADGRRGDSHHSTKRACGIG